MTILINKQINPYIIGRPIHKPEHFFGRNEIFAFIQDNLSQRTKVILLHGQRRIGKSSVLSQIPNFVKLDNFVFVILSLEGKSKKSLHDVLYELAREIKSYLEDELEFSVQSIEVAKREAFQEDRDVFTRDFLPQVYEVLGNKNLVLLFDEFDVLEDGAKDAAIDHFFPYLRSIIDKQDHLYIIPVVGRRLDDIPNLLQLFFHQASNQKIGLLRRENTEKLILKPVRGILEYKEEAVNAILELTSGHPYFTQVVCFALFSRAREEEKTKITREDVENIVERAIELGEGGLTWFRDSLPIPERIVLLVIAKIQE
ncbi:MAG: AAA-like domain-containing protein, partial [Spirulina sp.]